MAARLFGYNLSNESEFRFVMTAGERGDNCDNMPFAVSVHVSQSGLVNVLVYGRFEASLLVIEVTITAYNAVYSMRTCHHGRSIKNR